MKNLKLVMLISLLFVCLFYFKKIASFISCMFYNRCISIKEECVDNVCYAIVDESGISISSDVVAYFFSSSLFPIPVINKNYVLFDTNYKFCVIRKDNGKFELISRLDPVENNIPSIVHVTKMENHLPCAKDLYE
jgi:hypothetical protein